MGRANSNSVMSRNSIHQNVGTVEENLQDISATLRSRMNKLTLTFFDKYVEMEYEKFFLSKNLVKWRRNICVLFLSATAGYLYLMIKSPNDADEWVKAESDTERWTSTASGNDTIASILRQTCGKVMICSTCNPNSLCNGYNVKIDILFWTMGILLPFLAVLFTSFKLQAVGIGRHVHLLSAIFTCLVTVIGIFIRWFIVEPATPLYQTTYLSILSVTACFVFLRMRFIYSIICCCVIVGSYLVTSFLSLSANQHYRKINSFFDSFQITANHYNSIYSLALSVLALFAVTGIVSCSCFDTEIFYRGQFLVSHTLQKHNAKLTNQLKVLQKVYGNKAADFDSPLEKSVMIIRSLMADPSLTAQHLLELSQVLTLLGSSNLLAPDLENQVTEFMDTEQEAWLFSEIAPRRKTQRTRHSLAPRRRTSMAQEVHMKISETINETPTSFSLASIPESRMRLQGPGSPENESPKNESDGAKNVKDPAITTLTAAEKSSIPVHGGAPGMREVATLTMVKSESKVLFADSESPSKIRKSVTRKNMGFDDLIEIPRVVELLNKCTDFNWPIFDFADLVSGRSLSCLAYFLFKREGLFTHFQIPVDRFWKFIITIEQGYHADIPFHNATHACDVLHCISHFSHMDSIAKLTNEFDLLALFFAAIVHDYDHPGYNNNFLVNTYDVRTILYNDKSVLENHHLASAFTVLNKADCNFLSHMPKAEFKSLREMIIDMVLATDLSQHFVILSMFKNKVAQVFDPEESREDRILLWKILMKCSDVSNPTKEWSIYEKWCRLVLEEFMRQGDMEKRLNIPVSPYMDRDNLNVPSSQVGFIDYVILPLFEAYDKYIPIPHIMEDLRRNRDHWMYMKTIGVIHMVNVVPPPPKGSSLHTRESSAHVAMP
ncbi:cAMP-specific 3',5'-cyclic phosphodiesterase 4A [Dinochytrium kinnereticum]|nr:cAMP-specific 3',5'-cyclic phosphodiesterase 4A [Dinochytrium kinnereticum]